jgi:hypothetical protein
MPKIKENSMKPGWKTTEFWQTVIAQVLGFLAFAGVIGTNDSKTMEEALGKSVAAVFTLIVNSLLVVNYIRTRFHLKVLNGDTAKKLVILLVGSALFAMAAPAQAQMLPWRQGITQQLKQHEALINNLKTAPVPQSPAPQIIVMPPATPPLQTFPIQGTPQQALPIQGQPQQSFPIQGQPQQNLPIPGTPQQALPIQGQPQQQFPIQGTPQPLPAMPPAGAQSGPQAYSRQFALHHPN